MSKKFFENLTADERAEHARMIKPLRQGQGMSKKVVYTEAKISRQTLDNIESGATVPQAEVLKRVLDVVGYEVDEPEFEPQTETWLTVMGALIEAIPSSRRPQAADRAIRLLVSEARAVDGQSTIEEGDLDDSAPYTAAHHRKDYELVANDTINEFPDGNDTDFDHA